MKTIPLPSQKELHRLFDYDPATGDLIWKRRDDLPPRANGWNTRYAGCKAGTPDKDGYVIVRINGTTYKATRIIWCWLYDEDPGEDIIDHRDCSVANNRQSNLRRANSVQNMGNLGRCPERELPRGVTLRCDGKKWVAKIRFENAEIHLGSYDSIPLAWAAYAKAAREFRGEFARVVNV